MFLCEKHSSSFVIYSFPQCPLCKANRVIDASEEEIQKLKAEIKELKLQYGKNVLEEIREKARNEREAKREEGDIPIVPMDTPNPPHGE